MKLAVIKGQVVSTVKLEAIEGLPLLVVDVLNADCQPSGQLAVAADPIGAGLGETVLLVEGSSARRIAQSDGPIDLAVVGIVDLVTMGRQEVFRK